MARVNIFQFYVVSNMNRDKRKACLENNIDLLIDDSISNCSNVSNCGIETILIGNNEIKNITSLSNWKEIYKYIKNNFKQVEKSHIKMHYADDDFFVKKVDRGE